MTFDSNEELYMDWWLQELKVLGYISEIIHQPESFKLSDGISVDYFVPYKKKEGGTYVSESIMREHVYTPDVLVTWTQKAVNVFTTMINSDLRKKKGHSFMYILCDENLRSYIEVKPSFDQNNMTRLAKINLQWVWEKYGQYVNIVVPEKHFNKTFTPKKYFFTTKTKKPRTIKYKNVQTIEEFIKKDSLS